MSSPKLGFLLAAGVRVLLLDGTLATVKDVGARGRVRVHVQGERKLREVLASTLRAAPKE